MLLFFAHAGAAYGAEKAPSLSNKRWLTRAVEAAQKRNSSNSFMNNAGAAGH